MAHKVTLNYDGKNLTPYPPTIQVVKGETICFELGDGPPNAKVHITFDDPQFFSAAEYQQGEEEVRVEADLTKPTTYRCALLVDGVVAHEVEGAAGGGIEPGGGFAATV